MQWCGDASHLGERLGDQDDDDDNDVDDEDEDGRGAGGVECWRKLSAGE